MGAARDARAPFERIRNGRRLHRMIAAVNCSCARTIDAIATAV
jgi:hypothetical protein